MVCSMKHISNDINSHSSVFTLHASLPYVNVDLANALLM